MTNKLIEEANSLSLSGNFEDAIELLEQALDNNPGQHDILLLLWKNRLAAGDQRKADQAFKAVTDACEDPGTLRAIGHMLQKNGDTAMAIAVYGKYLELRPRNKAVWRRLTDLHHAAGDIEAEIDSCYRVAELEPDNAKAGIQLALLLISQQRLDEAEAALADVLVNHPDDHQVCYLYAGFLARSGRLGEALNYSKRALEAAPSNIMYQLEQADIYERQGEPSKAFDVLKPLLEHKNVPFDAVRIFAKMSPELLMKHEAGLLLDYISGRDEITEQEKAKLNEIKTWLASS